MSVKFAAFMDRLAQSPFYQQHLSPEHKTIRDLDRIGELPLTTKDHLREAGPWNLLAAAPQDVAEYFETYGTTGPPASAWFTRADLEAGGRQILDSGLRLTNEDRLLNRFPYALSLPAHLVQQAAWQAGACILPASSRSTMTPYPRIIELLRKLNVTVITGLAREMELLAETARLLGLDSRSRSDFPHLRALGVAGELLAEPRRRHIEELWGVPTYNLYGSTETANIAAMCEHGILHVADRDFHVEVLQEDLSGPVHSGSKGRAVITTLTHEGSPLLRYLNGDIISLESLTCPCGRTGPKLNHFGRSGDRISVGDRLLEPHDIHEAVYSLPKPPIAWKTTPGGDTLLVTCEWPAGETAPVHAASLLTEHLGLPVAVRTVESGILLDRQTLLEQQVSVKPQYIEQPSPVLLGYAQQK
ncbi:phenylacetate--CoA ligase family protein [Paenibacillus lutrae]|uniref:AMP-binding protein n=1 Tax=Paenibacillus lutrae TaxID=2078573 RepID=A0A7X3FMY1_9BACL|nr:AMP-binding protein [Paenibacillus lutrae]MVP02580.1 AMP-binding protein [Paenibacillus lutrae]